MPTLANERGVPFLDLARGHRPLLTAFRRKLDELVGTSQFVLGAEGEAFERDFAAHAGARHAIGVSNGTDALRLACEAAGVGPGDEVIVPAFTFVATAFGVSAVGAVPRFVDVSPDTFNLDPRKIEAAITPRTRAILPVHLFGHPADMGSVLAIAKRRGLKVVEDAAQAHGAEWQGRRAGSMGDLACFSFYPTKNLSALGDAGAITTDDDALADRLRVLRNLGQRRRYLHEVVGQNHRLDELQAAFLRIKLRRLDAWNAKRIHAAAAYDRALRGSDAVVPVVRRGCRSVFHAYSVLLPDRDAVVERLKAARIGYGIYYATPLPFQPCYRFLGHRPGDFPVAEDLSRRILSLPLFPEIRAAEIAAVARAVRG
jgi:dTDP-4-amino-4,6-dideoxygalactose transaminase